MGDLEDLESKLLRAVNDGGIADSGKYAESLRIDHQVVVGIIKSLLAYEMVIVEVIVHKHAHIACCRSVY
jgi:hypothetical protein